MKDEISVKGRKTLGHLDVTLKAIIQNSSSFGGVSLLVAGNFLQLSPANQKGVFMKLSNGSYRSRRVTRGGRGGGLPGPFSKVKEKCPDFGKKCPN